MASQAEKTPESVEETQQVSEQVESKKDEVVIEKSEEKVESSSSSSSSSSEVAAEAKEPEAKEEKKEEETQVEEDFGDDDSSSGEETSFNEIIQSYVLAGLKSLNLCTVPTEKKKAFDGDLSLKGVAKAISEGKVKNIITIVGAGISVAAGIPDFRSPGTGLYSKLEEYNLPYPEAIFTLNYFKKHPEPFCLLAKNLYPENFNPTFAHYFIRLLNDKGILLRNFTQNIDMLDHIAGLPAEKIVEAHGSFAKAHCVECSREFSPNFVKDKIFADEIPRCECGSLVKPDIVFFGESLPERFFHQMKQDFPQCDLLIVIGTSLKVFPFASLPTLVGAEVPRVLVNREYVGHGMFDWTSSRLRDVGVIGDIEDSIKQLAELLGWTAEVEALIAKGPVSIAH
eukprot:TRINITY_DN1213_c1_g1_i1.p1 TRINITY_DN1213_c1_g1~~TRINITY_DN1213_c1_g1_i1.p1  ORF type:complete len:404 (-),score=197.71 TRINITY_DN1213_c1_g1_i1:38-1228(-)